MNKSGGKHFMVMVLAVLFAATLMGHVKAEAQWEAEWQKTLEAAKQEGKVAVYGSDLPIVMRKHAPFIKKQFGIELEITSGRGSQIAQRLRKETAAGMSLADVVIAGGNPTVSFKQLGVTGPMDNKLILPEVTNPKLWYTQDHLPWFDDAKHFFYFLAYPNRDITINTDMVKAGEIKSWQDLLDPKYKGKIVWSDPTVSGSGFNGFCTNIMNRVTDENYYRKLVATQNITVTRDQRQMAEWLAKGKFAVAVSIPGPPIAAMLKAGAHIAHVSVKEGTYLSYGGGIVGIAEKAPHPNAAIVLVNWLLSKDGQTFAQKEMQYMSARSDIPTEGVNLKSTRVPGEKYFVAANSMEKWIMSEQGQYLALAKEIFGPVIGR
ncbi:MAG: extracellular solute-binding protein [Desulfobacterales bacterium]|nr:extracellular solute-binding protein [Desulfobacterales bacterium]